MADVQALAIAAADRYRLDRGVFLAQGREESGLQHTNADGSIKVSGAGARGAYQLMPATAAGLGVDPDDVAQNVEGAARLDRQLLDRYHGDYRLMLAAYNAGPGAVDQYGGVPPFAETQRYVAEVLSGGAVTVAPGHPATDSALRAALPVLALLALVWILS